MDDEFSKDVKEFVAQNIHSLAAGHAVFLRFWSDSGDRLFGLFSAAFLLLELTRFGLAMSHEPSESESYLYWVRLSAYLLILVAIIDKDQQRRP